MRFFIQMAPVPKGRPRFGKGRTYTPKTTKAATKLFALLLGPHRPEAPFVGPLFLEAEFVMPLPSSYARKLLGAPHPLKPDLDNLLKLAMDAITASQGWWLDDSLVARVHAVKRYQRKDETPGIWLELQRLMP